MSVITLSEAKAHLRVDQSSEDTLIQLYIEAAEDYAKRFLNRDELPAYSAIKAAVLLICAGLYENRESAGEKEIKENPAVMSLLHPYRLELGI